MGSGAIDCFLALALPVYPPLLHEWAIYRDQALLDSEEMTLISGTCTLVEPSDARRSLSCVKCETGIRFNIDRALCDKQPHPISVKFSYCSVGAWRVTGSVAGK